MIIFFAFACTETKGLDTAEYILEGTSVEVDPITLIDPTT